MASNGWDEDALETLFQDSLAFSYEDDEGTLQYARSLMDIGWGDHADITEDEREWAREQYYEVLDITQSEIDWDYWRELRGY